MSQLDHLVAAVKAGDEQRALAVADDKPSLLSESVDGASLPLLALYYGHEQLGRTLLQRTGGDADAFELSAFGEDSRLRPMLQRRPELVRERSADGFSLLALAAFFGRVQAVSLLLEEGADPNLMCTGNTKIAPLHSALNNGNSKIAIILLMAGADVNLPADGGWTPLHYAAQRDDPTMVERLLTMGADPRAQNAEGKTAADFATENGFTSIAERLDKAAEVFKAGS